MKTKLLLFTLLLLPTVFFGQTYLPFLEDGKVWTYEYYTNPYDDETQYYQVYVGSDTVVANLACKKMMESRQGVERCIGAFYEENGKVWAFYGKEQSGKLLYDFSCKEGDILTNLVSNLDDSHEVKVEKVELVESYGFKRRLVTLSITPPLLSGQKDVSGYWLEGIGSRFDMYSTWLTMGVTFFKSCSLNGVTIATQSSFSLGNVNDSEDEKKCATPTIAYDNGKLVFGCETEGVEYVYEIKCADAGSGRSGEVSLSQTYEIHVYATREGYYDSDVAVATIGWRNGQPVMEGFSSITMDGEDSSGDVNYDGKVDVADISKILSIMAESATK